MAEVSAKRRARYARSLPTEHWKMTWKTAPAGLYTFDSRTGRAVPILMVDEQGNGLLPGGGKTKHIYLIGAPQGDPANTAEQSQARRDYQAAVREAERNGIKPCQHGEPRGPGFCALCRRVGVGRTA